MEIPKVIFLGVRNKVPDSEMVQRNYHQSFDYNARRDLAGCLKLSDSSGVCTLA